MPSGTKSSSLVRILTPKGDVMGGGYLAAPRTIITCAHVVADALDFDRYSDEAPTKKVKFDFHLLAPHGHELFASVSEWYKQIDSDERFNQLEDIAILTVDEKVTLPQEAIHAESLELPRNSLEKIIVSVCGFPGSLNSGDWIDGKLKGPIGPIRVQFDTELGRRALDEGYSGSPVWDGQTSQVIGIVVADTKRSDDRFGYMIPIEAIVRAWPDFRSHCKRLPPDIAAEADVSKITAKLSAALASLQTLINSGANLSSLDKEDRETILNEQPVDLKHYLLSRVANWSAIVWQLDTHFTPLTLLLDQGEAAQGQRFVSAGDKTHRFMDLARAFEFQEQTSAFVLLGSPGSGKSTLLQRLELDTALHALTTEDPEPRVPLYLNLNHYKLDETLTKLTPSAWLQHQWQSKFPRLPALSQFLQEGRMLLLLDAINEMPRRDEPDFEEKIAAWADYLGELKKGNRLVFSCRTLDYSAILSRPPASPVPHIRIEPLEPDQVKQFLQKDIPDLADGVWQQLKKSKKLLEFYNSPFFLRLLVDQVGPGGELPLGRAALFTGFVRRSLQRETQPNHTLSTDSVLLSAKDRVKLATGNWKNAYDLPLRGLLFRKLQNLAFVMQEQAPEKEDAQVVIVEEQALAILDTPHDETIIKAGTALGVLDGTAWIKEDNLKYVHQLFQEYFAARQLAQAPQPNKVYCAWKEGELQPTVEQKLATIADYDPLPPPPTTGWEETTLMAASMCTDVEGFIRQLMPVNLPLAGQCANQPGIKISHTLIDELRQELLTRMRDPQADLRVRIAAGGALGELGDPRLQRLPGPHGEYLLPPLIPIPAGRYAIGSDEGLYSDEAPAHPLDLAAFALAQLPVSNAEWACFIQADGYNDERWWHSDAAKAWRRGENTDQGSKLQWRENRTNLQEHPDTIRQWLNNGQITSKQAEDWQTIAAWSDDEFDHWLDEQFSGGKHDHPSEWRNSAFNQPMQPVVGICWFEAMAYCAWLSAQTGLTVTLPSEAQWEAAARGRQQRRYAWGHDFDAHRCNSFESHIRGTTPVGVFAEGDSPDYGIADLSGNVWEWTRSHYKDYRYDAKDGREDLDDGVARRVVRGGSWCNSQDLVRCAARNYYRPDYRNYGLGLRLSCSSPIK